MQLIVRIIVPAVLAIGVVVGAASAAASSSAADSGGATPATYYHT